MVDKWTSILLKITLSPPLPLGVHCGEITLVITMWLSLFFSSKRQTVSLRTLIHQTQSSIPFMYQIPIFIIYAIIFNSEMICFIPHYRDQTAIAKVTPESFPRKLINSRKNFCGKRQAISVLQSIVPCTNHQC